MRVQTGITTLEISQNIDWLTASKEDRAKLYVVLRAISDLTGRTIEEQMEEAFGYKLLTGADYLRNFRRGAIARPKAKLIAAWITDHHADTARTIVPELFPVPAIVDWDTYIQNHVIIDKLHIVRLPKGLGIVERVNDCLEPDETLRLGERFFFQLESDIEGHAVAFQGYRGEWHPLPLGDSMSDLTASILLNHQSLPRHSDHSIIPLQEKEDLGVHQFFIVVSEDVKNLPDMANQALHDCLIHSVTVEFIS